MKAIYVMFDSLNRRMLPPYGCDWVHAPNFQRLAQKTLQFTNSYVGSMPCMPARRELHTGRYNFLHRSWGPLEPFDRSMPEILKQNNVYTHLATDHYHYFEDGGATYHNRYSSFEFFRGQEYDQWKGQVSRESNPALAGSLNHHNHYDHVNRSCMKEERQQPQPQTFAAGLDFINRNHTEDNWFLQLETFDPHEPFVTHRHYQDLYPHSYTGSHFDWPPYDKVTQSTQEVEHMRYMYAALVSMCDRYLGDVLDTMDRLNMWDDTMLIVGTDHGYLLGEHDWWAKCVMPFYQEVAHTPLFIWDPRSKKQNETRDALVQTIDIAPTLLDFFGVEIPEEMQGKSLKPVIENDQSIREGALFGLFGGHVNYTDGKYVYMLGPQGNNLPLYEYTLMPAHMRTMFDIREFKGAEMTGPFSFTRGCPLMKIPGRNPFDKTGRTLCLDTLLYDVQEDPNQNHALENPRVEKDLKEKLRQLMIDSESPKEQFERLGIA